MFTKVNMSGNLCVFANLMGDVIYFTIIETGFMKIQSISQDGLEGEAFVELPRFENFNYKSKETKSELAKFVFEKMNSLSQSKNFISGINYCEVNFVIDKKMFFSSVKVKRVVMSNTPTQITV
ncbi:MAG: hypothetical protein EBV07_01860 [Proteobacteria bacterium]|nr:hypothetical protein [Pseudomonadota bacterium]